MGDHEGTLKIENNDISIKTKLILIRFTGTFWTLCFDEKSIWNTLLGFTPYWDYKPTNENHTDSPGVYTSENNIYLSTIQEIHLKCDVVYGSAVYGLRQPILYSLALDKLPGY